jgi:hypothetical protein
LLLAIGDFFTNPAVTYKYNENTGEIDIRRRIEIFTTMSKGRQVTE